MKSVQNKRVNKSILIFVLVILIQSSGLVFSCSFCPEPLAWAGKAQSLIRANDRSDPVLLVQGQNLALKVTMQVEGDVQDPRGWVVAQTPWGWFSTQNGSGWVEGLLPLTAHTFQSARAGLDLPGLNLPAGEYGFYAVLTSFKEEEQEICCLSSVQVTVLPGLETRDTRPLKTKTPVILIHGNMSEHEPEYRWGRFIELAEDDQLFYQRHKLYLFRWSSSFSNTDNGAALGAAMRLQEELWGRSVVLVAHSRGGLVARSFMNRFTLQEGQSSGQPGGERVQDLVTLGAPHKGSPGADLVWSAFSFDLNYSPLLAKFLTQWYVDALYRPENAYMLWDDSQGLLTTEPICWYPSLLEEQFCSPLLSVNSPLSSLNTQERYFSKIVAFGGSARSDGLFSLIGEVFSDHNPVDNSDLHAALSLASRLMSDFPLIPDGYPEKAVDLNFRPFQHNDGLVPLDSALFLDVGDVEFSQDKAGRLSFDQESLNQACRLKECIVIEDRFTDHLDYLDDDQLLLRVLEKLNTLH